MPLFAVGKGDVLPFCPSSYMIPDELVMGQDEVSVRPRPFIQGGSAGSAGFARFLGRAAYTMWAVFMLPALTPSTMPW